jgi:hypothetical protein
MDKYKSSVSVKLADYTVISSAEKTDRGGWVNFGVNNLFPQYLRELAQTGAVHGSLCISIGDMIAGKNLEAGVYNRRLTELDAYEVFYGCAHDYKKYGGFYMEVIYTYDRESVARLRHIPFEECRLGVSGEDEEIGGVWHSNDWAAPKRKRNKPEFIPLYNVAKKSEEPRQIYYCFNYTSGQFYPRPDYYSAINSIELAKEISVYHINNIVNGLMPSFIVSMFQGAPDPDQQNDIKRDWERELTGAKNAGKFIMTFNERDTPKPDIITFPLSDADKQYQFLSTESTSLIMVAHRVTTPLLFGIRDVATGFGSNKDEMAVGLEIFTNQVIEPAQRKISKAFEEVLSFEMPGIKITVVPNTPLKMQVATAVTPALAAQFEAEKKKDCCSAEGENVELSSEVAEELIALGEDAPEGYILIDSYEVDYENDDLENEELLKIEAHELAVSTGSAKAMAPSDQDETNYAGVTFMTRYRYFGRSSSNRPFCAKMLAADKLYRKEDIEAMENKAVNPKWGPNGTDYYSIWLYKGGGNCNHAWRKETFINAKGINPLANDAQRIAVAKAAKMGYRVKNDELVALLPIDMDYNGFLPTNPVYGIEGKNYRR